MAAVVKGHEFFCNVCRTVLEEVTLTVDQGEVMTFYGLSGRDFATDLLLSSSLSPPFSAL